MYTSIIIKNKFELFGQLGSGMTIPNWSFFGNTMVTTSFIRLTPDVQSRQGMVWNDVVSNIIFVF